MVIMFFFGFMQLKVGVSYVWLQESVHSSDKVKGNTMINVWDALPVIQWSTLMYFGLARNWLIIHVVHLSLGYFALAIVFFSLVESPKWLLMKGRKGEAI